jgi:hypothetical protein
MIVLRCCIDSALSNSCLSTSQPRVLFSYPEAAEMAFSGAGPRKQVAPLVQQVAGVALSRVLAATGIRLLRAPVQQGTIG